MGLSHGHSEKSLRRTLAQLFGMALVTGLLPLAAVEPARAAGLQESEPNSSASTADQLPIGVAMGGSLSSSSDNDYFYFDLSKDARLGLDFTFANDVGAGNVYDLILYDDSNAQRYRFDIGGGDWDGSWASAYAMYLSSGRYYVRVVTGTLGQTAAVGKSYTLRVTAAAGFVETEPNNSAGTADSLPLGAVVMASLFASSTDEDYFYFDLPQAGGVLLFLRFPGDLGTANVYDLIVYDDDNREQYRFDVNGGAWRGSSGCAMELSAGRYHVRVVTGTLGERAAWGRPYTLQVLRQLTAATPALSGSATFGSTLTAKTGAWGPSGVKIAYQWLLDGKVVPGATGATYKLAASDVKHKISVKVTGSLSGHLTVSKTSVARTVTAAKFSAAPVPKISGTAKVKKTLKAKTGTWKPSGIKLTYQWYRNGKKISGATKSGYRLVKADKGKKITVKVTGKKSGYTTVTRTSKATKKVR